MEKRSSPLRRLAATLVAVALAAGWAASARAQIAYAFASQNISNITFDQAGLPPATGVVTSTAASATQNGSGPTTSDPVNTPQAFIGGAPAAPQNVYTRYADGVGTPTSPTTPQSFSRGDAGLFSSGPPPGTGSTPIAPGTFPTTAANVAESFLNAQSPTGVSTEGATGSYQFGFTFTGTGNALNIRFNFANQLALFASPGASAIASFQLTLNIRSVATGALVFSAIPTAENRTQAVPPPTGALLDTGILTGAETVTVGAGTLLAGAQYIITFAGTETTFTAVPEPGSVTLVAVSGALALGVGAVRRRGLRRAPK
jgi:hypothetical protein